MDSSTDFFLDVQLNWQRYPSDCAKEEHLHGYIVLPFSLSSTGLINICCLQDWLVKNKIKDEGKLH